MKKKSWLLCLVLCLVSVFGLFGLTACGETSISDVKASFKSLEETYTKFSTVISSNKTSSSDGNLQYSLTVTLGGNILSQSQKAGKTETYKSITSTYRDILEIANDYVMSNKEYINGLSDGDLSKDAKNCLESLNNALGSYKSQISVFASRMNEFNSYLGSSEIDDEGEKVKLQSFKKEYGKLVTKGINLSSEVASFVENTGVFNVLKKGAPTTSTFITLKNYIRIKMLPIFSRYKLDKIENVYDYYSKLNDKGDAYTRVNKQLAELDTLFTTYKTTLVTSTVGTISGTEEDLIRIFNQIYENAHDFFTEETDYFKALNGIDFHALAELDYDSADYAAKNKNFLRYMDKIDVFVGVDVNGVLENFITQLSKDFKIN